MTTLRFYRGARPGEYRADPLPDGPRFLIRRESDGWLAFANRHGLDVDEPGPDLVRSYSTLRDAKARCRDIHAEWKRESRATLAAFLRGEVELR
jgi:hypothetical protein